MFSVVECEQQRQWRHRAHQRSQRLAVTGLDAECGRDRAGNAAGSVTDASSTQHRPADTRRAACSRCCVSSDLPMLPAPTMLTSR
jgi:hypothetical protein